MAFLQKKGLQDSPGKTLSPGRTTERRGVLPSRSGKRSLLDDDFFSKLAEEAEKEDEESDVSEADPMALLESMKDTDDMDADLFGSKKKTSYTPTPSVAKSARDGDPKEDPAKSRDALKQPETDDVLLDQKRPSSLAAATRGHRKSNLADMDDPLDDLLDDLGTIKEPKDTKSTVTEKTGLSMSEPQKTTQKEETGKATPPARAPKKRDELTFDDDEDDLMDALGFGESPKVKTGLFSAKRESEPPPSTTTRLDEILGRGTSPKLLERPPTGEKKDLQREKNPVTKDSPFGEDDFTFGSYQPSVASPLEGRQSRRQSVRFSTEDANQSPERKPRSAPPSTPTTARPSKPAADWLGLKQEEEEVKSEEPLQVPGSLKPPSSPGPSAESSRPVSAGGAASGAKLAETTPSSPKAIHSAAKPEGSAGQGDDDWLVGALTRKKTLAATRSEEKKPPTPKQRELQGLGEEVDLDSFLSKPSSPAPRRKLEETPAPGKESRSSPLPWETPRRQANSPHLSGPMKEDQPKPVKSPSSSFAELDQFSLPPPVLSQTEHVRETRQAPAGGANTQSEPTGVEISAQLHHDQPEAKSPERKRQSLSRRSQSEHTDTQTHTPPVQMPGLERSSPSKLSQPEHLSTSDAAPSVLSDQWSSLSKVVRPEANTDSTQHTDIIGSLHHASPSSKMMIQLESRPPPGLTSYPFAQHPSISAPVSENFPQIPAPVPQISEASSSLPPGPSPLLASGPPASPHPFQPSLQGQRAPGWANQVEASPSYPVQLRHMLPSTMPDMLPNTMWLPQQRQREKNTPAVQSQVSLSADSLQPRPVQQQLAQSHHGGLGGTVELGAALTQRVETEGMASQAYIIHLEGQVRSMQLERDQARMLLENIQHRHKQDIELIESKHRTSVKLLEESLAQREARWLQEKEDLAERLATATRLAEQERSELQAQYQRRLSQIQEDRDSEVKRLQELQRKSILEMKKDHEEQVQRLKRLKDEEIDAVTSATSQTRSLTVVIEQMEQFSRRLGDLSSRVESSHEHTAQGLEMGARQRDEQLRIMQDRLSQQERAMGEERSRLKEVITKMEAQLAEQQRQLEKERWRVSADQAKAESAQRALEEERRSMMQHISMEREELERAKSALLEEQQAVMKHCAEERRKLTAEWAQFHAQEKQRQEWAEREARRALERDASREGSIISMAQEQADLKLRAAELRQREEAAAREREALQRQREELEQERERINAAALRLKTRAQELEGFSKMASEKYEEGEGALQEARKLETEHLSRLRTIHTQMERLRQQEQHLHQEQMRVTDHRREEGLRQGVPFTPLPQSAAPVLPVFASTQLVPHTIVPQPVSPLSSPGSAEMQARLALLRHAAEKDRDFLQDEQFFLETLKKAPYNTTFHTS